MILLGETMEIEEDSTTIVKNEMLEEFERRKRVSNNISLLVGE